MQQREPLPQLSLRDRLKGLMAFRVVLVTLFLGGTIAVDIDTLASLSDSRNLALLSLIVLTYVLTIVYSVSLQFLRRLSGLAILQLSADMVLSGALVVLTGGLDSLFIFLFYINIITTAVVSGRAAALWTAGATAAILTALGLLTVADPSIPLVRLGSGTRPMLPLGFEVGVNVVAAFVIALLAGHLRQRLGEISGRLAQKEVDLRKLRTLTQNILASLNSGLITVDEHGHVIYVNRAAAAISGLSASHLHGQHLEDVFPTFAAALEESPGDDPDDASPPSLPDDSRYECRYDHPDGDTIFLGFSLAELCDDDGEAFGHIVVFQDLTAIKKLEAKNRRAERMAAVGELAASIAHEIRNPLASISGSVEMLESTADLDAQDRNLMNIILREVDRLDLLISEFLDYSRPPSMDFGEADLGELVHDVVELFDKRDTPVDVETSLSDDADSSPDRTTLTVDREAIRQSLWNLLINAEKALEDDATDAPTIRVEHDHHPDHEFPHVLVVEDNGPGIPEEVRERIFEPFFTTREHGSGLGLATTHRLIQEHDGQISVADSTELGGARFVVQLRQHPPLGHDLHDDEAPDSGASPDTAPEPADTAESDSDPEPSTSSRSPFDANR